MISCLSEGYKSGSVKASSKSLEEIPIVPFKYTRIHTLSLANNYISSLENIQQFKNIDTILLENNKISKIGDLEPLNCCRKLTSLSIYPNPVCKLPLFMAHIIRICPNLQTLDGKQISQYLSINYSKPELEGLLELESKCFNCILVSKKVKSALKLSSATKDIPPFIAIDLVNIAKENEIEDKIREKCKGMTPAKYYVYLREKIERIHSKISQFAQISCENKNAIATHSRTVVEIGRKRNIDDYLQSLNTLIDATEKLVEQEQESIESIVIPNDLSSEKSNCSDDFRSNGNKERGDKKEFNEDSESSFDDGSSRRLSTKSDNDLDDEASDEERLQTNGEGISEEITQSAAITSEGYPTESERHLSVTFMKNTISNHNDGLQFDASQGDQLTEQSSAVPMNKQDTNQELSDASDFDTQIKPSIIRARNPPRDRIIAFSSEMFASRGESMDSMSNIPPKSVVIESACSDFDKVESVHEVKQRSSLLGRTKNSDFEASRGESLGVGDVLFNGNDSDSLSAFPQPRAGNFVHDLSKFFRRWKLAHQNQSSLKETAMREMKIYCEMCKLKSRIEQQKNTNKALKRSIKTMVKEIQEMKQNETEQDRATPKRQQKANDLSPKKSASRSFMRSRDKTITKNSSIKKN